jgi:type VI secretion system secreted protein VgrG
MTTTNTVQIRIESTVHEELQIARVEGHERISAPFVFDVALVAVGGAEISADDFVGTQATLVFEEGGTELRRLYARVAAARDELDANVGYARFRLRLVPRMDDLALVHTSEVFLDRTIPQIIEEKLARIGLTSKEDVAFRLRGNYPQKEFVLQYRETDLAFVSRLAENAGIAFHFEHGTGKDVVVFTDANEGFGATVPVQFEAQGDRVGIYELAWETEVFPGKHVLMDYDDDHPKLDLTVKRVVDAKYPGEVVEYGALYVTPAAGKDLAAVRAEERVAKHRMYRGTSGRPLAAGEMIDVSGHSRLRHPRMLLTDVEHKVTQTTMTHGMEEAKAETYRTTFRATVGEETFRPERRTPRPRIDGFVHAMTDAAPAGASARVAQLDELGRYTVRFLFDTAEAEHRRVRSARVRMMQAHAGPGYGMHLPLKPDVEVLVAFIDGDPDRPIIAGAVPNLLTKSPVTSKDPLMHRIETESGIYIRMKDG